MNNPDANKSIDPVTDYAAVAGYWQGVRKLCSEAPNGACRNARFLLGLFRRVSWIEIALRHELKYGNNLSSFGQLTHTNQNWTCFHG